MTVWVPGVRAEVDACALAPSRVTGPARLAPSTPNWTLPPSGGGSSVAVKVTGWPASEGLGAEARASVVAMGPVGAAQETTTSPLSLLIVPGLAPEAVEPLVAEVVTKEEPPPPPPPAPPWPPKSPPPPNQPPPAPPPAARR